MILPVTVFLGVFFIYPFILVSQQAFQSGAGVGLSNFENVFSHWKFPISLHSTNFMLVPATLLAIAVLAC